MLRKIFNAWLTILGVKSIRGHTFIVPLLPETITIADFGAHKGDFCDSISKVRAIRRALLIEVNPDLHADLTHNWRDPRWQILHAAVGGSGHAPSKTLYLSENPEASSMTKEIADAFGCKGAVEVPTIALQASLDAFESDRINLVKMDIEGAELDALESASPDALARVDQLTVEFHDNFDPAMSGRVSKVRSKLTRECGFLEINASWPGTDDILFVNERSLARIGQFRWHLIYVGALAAYFIRGLVPVHVRSEL